MPVGQNIERESIDLGWAWLGKSASSCRSSRLWLLSVSRAEGRALCVHAGAQAEGAAAHRINTSHGNSRSARGQTQSRKLISGPCLHTPANILLAKTSHTMCQLSIF